jgi:phage tail protein X
MRHYLGRLEAITEFLPLMNPGVNDWVLLVPELPKSNV